MFMLTPIVGRADSVLQITRLSVTGFKSLRNEQTIQLKPLTILAGANSAGKSSIVKPILLFKQTLEATYDPGPLRLDGPNVGFSEASQLFFSNKRQPKKSFEVSITLQDGQVFKVTFVKGEKQGVELSQFENQQGDGILTLSPNLSSEEVKKRLTSFIRATFSSAD